MTSIVNTIHTVWTMAAAIEQNFNQSHAFSILIVLTTSHKIVSRERSRNTTWRWKVSWEWFERKHHGCDNNSCFSWLLQIQRVGRISITWLSKLRWFNQIPKNGFQCLIIGVSTKVSWWKFTRSDRITLSSWYDFTSPIITVLCKRCGREFQPHNFPSSTGITESQKNGSEGGTDPKSKTSWWNWGWKLLMRFKWRVIVDVNAILITNKNCLPGDEFTNKRTEI